jgi:hypothetical protein
MPVIILFCVVLPQQYRNQRFVVLKNKMRRERAKMTNEVIRKYIGSTCTISSGSFAAVTGKIIEVNENWIEVETKKGRELVNADYIQSIKITEGR